MHTRIRIPAPAAPLSAPNIPLLEADDLPGDDDWAFLNAVSREGDEDFDLSFHPDFD